MYILTCEIIISQAFQLKPITTKKENELSIKRGDYWCLLLKSNHLESMFPLKSQRSRVELFIIELQRIENESFKLKFKTQIVRMTAFFTNGLGITVESRFT